MGSEEAARLFADLHRDRHKLFGIARVGSLQQGFEIGQRRVEFGLPLEDSAALGRE